MMSQVTNCPRSSPVPRTNEQDVLWGLPKVCSIFLVGVRERYVSTLDVIDEALQSKQLKDRMWAVELLLKKLSPTRLLHDLSSFSQLFQTKKTELTQTSKASGKQGAANDLLVNGAEWNHLNDEQLQEELSRLFDTSLSPDKDSSTGSPPHETSNRETL